MTVPTTPGCRARRLAVTSTTGALLVAVLAACGGADDAPVEAGALRLGEPAAGTAPAAPGAAPGTGTASPSAPGRTVVDDGADLEVEDQSGDGTGVVVESVRLSSGSGHVVVRTRDGQVLGSAPVAAGSSSLTVVLDPPLTGSGELVAVLHADDGDGAFDPARDAGVVDDDGDAEVEDFDYRVQ